MDEALWIFEIGARMMIDTAERPDRTAPMDARNLGRALASHPLFANIEVGALASISDELEWFSLPGGWILFREGDPADALYFVTSGCLAATVRQHDGRETTVARIQAGETVGEMALISGEPRSASVVALRDSSLLRITKQNFDELIKRHPAAMFHLTELLVHRLVQTTHPSNLPAAPKTIALVPLDSGVACADLARGLSDCLTAAGMQVCLLDLGAAGRTAEWFHAIERTHDAILYRAEPDASAWTQLCLRQADRILVVARSAGVAPMQSPLESILKKSFRDRCDLIVVHARNARPNADLGRGLESLPVDLYCQVRLHEKGDLARLARLLSGRAVGVVLSSGGARGFAHLGAIRALREASVPIDLVCGTSMGAIVAAGVALEWDDAEFKTRLRHAFVTSKPLNDYTFPLIALARGRKVTRLLRRTLANSTSSSFGVPISAFLRTLPLQPQWSTAKVRCGGRYEPASPFRVYSRRSSRMARSWSTAG